MVVARIFWVDASLAAWCGLIELKRYVGALSGVWENTRPPQARPLVGCVVVGGWWFCLLRPCRAGWDVKSWLVVVWLVLCENWIVDASILIFL